MLLRNIENTDSFEAIRKEEVGLEVIPGLPINPDDEGIIID